MKGHALNHSWKGEGHEEARPDPILITHGTVKMWLRWKTSGNQSDMPKRHDRSILLPS